LKDDLGAGVYPSAKFGANAAWLRLQVLTHNLLELLKAVALDGTLRSARPKRLRFVVFSPFGRVVTPAREQLVRIVDRVLDGLLRPALRRLALAPWPPLDRRVIAGPYARSPLPAEPCPPPGRTAPSRSPPVP